MTTAALPGAQRLRAFQLGAESAMNTAVATTRRMPWKFAPTVDPQWTDPDVDTGTLERALPPYRMAMNVTGQASGPLAYDDIPDLQTGLLLPITPTGAGADKTWTAAPASKSLDPFQTRTAEWGDDVATDGFQYVSGILEQVQLTFPEDLGPVQIQANYRFSKAVYPHTLTAALDVDLAPHWVYAADSQLYIDDAAGGIGATALVDVLHGATVTLTQQIDVKRFMNGSNARFQASGYGRGLRTVEITPKFAKGAAALSEAAKWLNANAQERFMRLLTESPDVVGATASHYMSDLRWAGYWYTRNEDTSGQANTAFSLVCRNRYNATLGYGLWWQAVNARAAL